MNRLVVIATASILTACSGAAQTPVGTGQSVRTVTVTEPTVAITSYGAAPVPTAAPSGPKSVIETDGTYLVGTDILPGTYRTPGGSQCYWARLRSLETSDIIDNNNSSGPQVVEILATDRAFLTHNCQTWSLAATAPVAAAAPPVNQEGAISTLPEGADAQGFSDGPRCSYRAALLIRTAESQVVVCDDGSGAYIYKGLRLKDNGRIDLSGAVSTASGFTVSNTDGTRYDVSRSGLVIYTGGDVYTEPAIASGP